MANYSLDITGAISTGWEYAKKYGLMVAVIFLLVGIATSSLQNILGSTVRPEVYEGMSESIARRDWDALAQYAQMYNNSIGTAISTFLSIVISFMASVGLYNLVLGLMGGRMNGVSFDAFKLPFNTYVKVFAVQLIVSIILGFSIMLCIIPFFFVAPRLIFAPIYAVENPEADIMESIKASWRMTTDNTFSMLGLGIALGFINIIGFLCCCVGLYFAEALALFATIAAYNQLKGNLY